MGILGPFLFFNSWGLLWGPFFKKSVYAWVFPSTWGVLLLILGANLLPNWLAINLNPWMICFIIVSRDAEINFLRSPLSSFPSISPNPSSFLISSSLGLIYSVPSLPLLISLVSVYNGGISSSGNMNRKISQVLISCSDTTVMS